MEYLIFDPMYGEGETVIPDLTPLSMTLADRSTSVCLTNLHATETAWVRIDDDVTVDAAIGVDYPVLAGTQVTIAKLQDENRISYVAAAPGSLNILPGNGV